MAQVACSAPPTFQQLALPPSADGHAEKTTRGLLKATADRSLSKRQVVVLDSLNFIKGFRYELWYGFRVTSLLSLCHWHGGRGNWRTGRLDETDCVFLLRRQNAGCGSYSALAFVASSTLSRRY